MKPHALALFAVIAAPNGAHAAAEMELTLGDIGLREYYCTHEMTLRNLTGGPVMEVSGHFHFYIGDERVGRSKGTWFMNLGPGESATAVFETPNAPCTEVERYEFVVGACRLDGPGFEPVAVCAEKIAGQGRIEVLQNP